MQLLSDFILFEKTSLRTKIDIHRIILRMLLIFLSSTTLCQIKETDNWPNKDKGTYILNWSTYTTISNVVEDSVSVYYYTSFYRVFWFSSYKKGYRL